MPLYRCTLAPEVTSPAQRAQMAREITRIHCEVTGAPAKFVHAFFAEDEGGRLPEGKRAVVIGSIRAGRTPDQKARIAADMRKSLAGILGGDEDRVLVATVDVPARWVMEGGAIMPEPGEEEAWLATHAR